MAWVWGPVMDPRREVGYIFKHFTRYHESIGEALIYYVFNAENSQYDEVYDEGFRQYHVGVRIPILWIDQMEAVEDYAPEGRRPTQRMRCAVSARNMYENGVSVTEVHGNQLTDTSPANEWRRDRMHDLFWYDNRYWEVSGFQIRGRVKGEDVVIGVTGIETFPADDMLLDYAPGTKLVIEEQDAADTHSYRATPKLREEAPGVFIPQEGIYEDPPGSGGFNYTGGLIEHG